MNTPSALRPRSTSVQVVAYVGAAVALLAIAQLPTLLAGPPLFGAVNRDSGYFLYAAWRILNGDIPYKDLWDHKTPAIYFINAMGLVLGGGSYIGVWFLQWLSLGIAALASFRALSLAFGARAAAFATLAWIISLPTVLQGGDVTQQWALPLQFLGLLVFVRGRCSPKAAWAEPFLFGVLGGLAALLQQNLVGLWVAGWLVYVVDSVRLANIRELTRRSAFMALGILMPFAAALLYLTLNGALQQFVEQAIGFNRLYASGIRSLVVIAQLAFRGVWYTGRSGIVFLAGIAWVLALADLVRRRTVPSDGTVKAALTLLLCIWLPIEVLLSSLSEILSPNYYMAWLPVLAMGTAALVVRMGRLERSWRYQAALLAIMAVVPSAMLVMHTWSVWPSSEENVAVEFVRQNSAPEDTVLVWGAEPGVNFLARRASPTRFAYQWLFVWYPTYTVPNIVVEFFQSVHASNPRLVVDTSASDPSIPPIDTERRRAWSQAQHVIIPAELETGLQSLQARYTELGEVGSQGWVVYRTAT